MQLAELVRGVLVGGQQHNEVLLVLAGGGELDVVKAEQSRDGVPEFLAVALEPRRSVLLPEFGEPGAGGGEGGDELGAAGLTGVQGQVRAELARRVGGLRRAS